MKIRVLPTFCFCVMSMMTLNVAAQFTEIQAFTWPSNSSSVFNFGDTDNDGDMDLVRPSSGQIVILHENNGDNNYGFPMPITAEEAEPYHNLELNDFDGDGDLDIVAMTNPSGEISLFTNEGENTFSREVIYTTIFGISKLKLIDMDNDGDQDIVFVKNTNALQWLKNNGDGSVALIEITLATENITVTHYFDGDNDGDMDICYHDLGSTGINYVQNLGDETFSSPVILIEDLISVNSMISIDRDDDGDLDLLYVLVSSMEVMEIENLGESEFGETSLFMTGFDFPILNAAKDLDFDGKEDLIISSQPGQHFGWRKNLGGGLFAPAQVLIEDNDIFKASFFDFDNDGDYDFAGKTNDNSFVLFENLGDLEFSPINFLSETTNQPVSTFTMDVDEDGIMDLVCGSRADSKVSWVRNIGDGTFSELRSIGDGDHYDPQSISSADIDADGHADLIIASSLYNELFWYPNLGGGEFGDKILISDEWDFPKFVISDDWDGDGDIDVLASYYSSSQLILFENVAGTFDPAGVIIATDEYGIYTNSADLDNDGDNDIIWSSPISDHIKWLENTGDLTFSEHLIAEDMIDCRNFQTVDMDEDGDLDIIASCFGSSEIYRIENLGGAIFDDPVLIVTAPGTLNVRWEDLNNDGFKDLVVVEVSNIVWYENIGVYEFSDREFVTETIGVEDIEIYDFDGDGDNDIGAIVYNNVFGWYRNMSIVAHSANGKVFIDANENGVFDEDDELFHIVKVLSEPETFYSFTNVSGEYMIAFDEGELDEYTIFPYPIPYWYLTTEESYDIVIEEGFTLYDDLNFGFAIEEVVNEVDVFLTGGGSRIDTETNYWINYSNVGSTKPHGMIHMQLDDSLTYVSSEITPELIDGQDLYWSYDDLYYFEDRGFNVTVLMPTIESLGRYIKSYVTIDVDSAGTTLFTNIDNLYQFVNGPYDPNDKSARPSGTTEYGYIAPETETLEYLIRFQNTGTDTAYNVVIEDQLDPNLDWTSLRPLAWSHDMEIEADHDGLISFVFDNIMLPDSNVNQLASNGFVKYEIDLLPGLPLETSIYNTAHIFFDFNPAIITNTTVNTLHVDDNSGITENGENQITVYPNPFSDIMTITFGQDLTAEHTVIIYDILGTEVYRLAHITGQQIQISKSDIGSGLYFLSVLNSDSKRVLTTKLIAE